MLEYLLRPLRVEIRRLADGQAATNAALTAIRKDLVYLRRAVAKLLLPVPGPLEPRLKAERNDNMLVYTAGIPALSEAEQAQVTAGELVSIRFRDNKGVVTDLPVDAAESPEFTAADDEEVTISLTNVDNAGNESTAVTQTFAAKDTIPPEAPGGFGEIKLVREE